MPDNRFFTDTDFVLHQSITIKGEEAHHLAKVMRAKINDTVELINGKNVLAQAIVTQLSTKQASLEIIKLYTTKPKGYLISLHLALIHPSKLDFVVEKATELGVNEIHIFTGDKSKKFAFSEEKMKRLKKLCVAALKQSGHLALPTIYQYPTIYDYPQIEGSVYYGELHSHPTKLDALDPLGSYHLFIGPESGFSENEKDFIQKTFSGKPLTINSNILRAETAAISATVLFNYLLSLE